MKIPSRNHGFTVLELLIVIAIMCLLITLVLVGLNQARAHARDENQVTNLHTVVVGLHQYFDICRQYPATLDGTESCTDINNNTVTLAEIIPTLSTYQFGYVGTIVSGNDVDSCTGFHIGVVLGGSATGFNVAKAGEAPVAQANICQESGGQPITNDPTDGTNANTFDLTN